MPSIKRARNNKNTQERVFKNDMQITEERFVWTGESS